MIIKRLIRKYKAFTLVELLVAMAIIAILLGLSIIAINIVQRNARDMVRMQKVKEIETQINGLIANKGGNWGVTFSSLQYDPNTGSFAQGGGLTINLPDFLNRGTWNHAWHAWDDPTDALTTNYCIGTSWYAPVYVVGVALESGENFFRTNNGGTYTTIPQTVNGLLCNSDML